ncbi:MAG: TraR/DksA C4-type zinc finger protein [Acidimicrobiales bacterium]
MDDVAEYLARTRATTVLLITDLEDDLAAIVESTRESPDDEHDPEGSTVGFERARVGSLLARTRRSLSDIDEALERVRQGTYGTCERCGDSILSERLKVLPTARLCIACAVSSYP